MGKWSLNLDRYAKVKKKKIEEVRKVFAFLLYSNIVKLTPVDKGRARGNWLITSNQPNTQVFGDSTIKHQSLSSVPTAKGDESYFISNNVEYINMLEYGGYSKNSTTGKTKNGYSIQAPNGMVGVTVAKVNTVFDEAIKAVVRGGLE